MSLRSVIAAAGERGIRLGGTCHLTDNSNVIKLSDGSTIRMGKELYDKVIEQKKFEESRPGHEDRHFTIDGDLGLVELVPGGEGLPGIVDEAHTISGNYEKETVQNILGLSDEDYEKYEDADLT